MPAAFRLEIKAVMTVVLSASAARAVSASVTTPLEIRTISGRAATLPSDDTTTVRCMPATSPAKARSATVTPAAKIASAANNDGFAHALRRRHMLRPAAEANEYVIEKLPLVADHPGPIRSNSVAAARFCPGSAHLARALRRSARAPIT